MTPDPLTEAGEQVKKWTAKRDRLIVEAEGSSRQIAARVGLSHMQIINIRKRAECSPS